MAVRVAIVGGRDRVWLLGKVRAALKVVGVREGEWTISVVGDEEMGALHDRTMGLPETTDVLTFDLREVRSQKSGVRRQKDKEGAAVELDTVICVDEARRRAGEMGHSVREELLLYCVHSLLHVQGYDDVTAGGAKKMHAREDEVLEAIGVGAVYGERESRKPKTEIRMVKAGSGKGGCR